MASGKISHLLFFIPAYYWLNRYLTAFTAHLSH